MTSKHDLYVETYDRSIIAVYATDKRTVHLLRFFALNNDIKIKSGGRKPIHKGGIVMLVTPAQYGALLELARTAELSVWPIYDHERDQYPELEPDDGWPEGERAE
jgi:hypothetical protein